jgi:hypothetical protein
LIDAKNGYVRFPALSLELRPLMSEAEFVSATSSLNRDNLGANGGWQRYSIRELIPNDQRLGIFFVFLEGRLKMVSFAYAHKDESWETWSEAGELEREKQYREELAAQLGGETSFPWGTASAQLDSKSGGTDIWINFSDFGQANLEQKLSKTKGKEEETTIVFSKPRMKPCPGTCSSREDAEKTSGRARIYPRVRGQGRVAL